jgi:ribosomal protein L30E
MARYSRCKTIDAIVRNLLKTGEWIIKSNNRHYRLENENTKHCITVPGTPSDRRSTLNWIHQLKRAGVEVCF